MEVSKIVEYADKICFGVTANMIKKESGIKLIMDLYTLIDPFQMGDGELDDVDLHLKSLIDKIEGLPS